MQYERGWLLPELVRLDQKLRGRWALWEATMQTSGSLGTAPFIHFLGVADEGFEQCLQMVVGCLQAIPKHWETANYRLMPYFVDWLLFAFGHPIAPGPPREETGFSGAQERLTKALDLEMLLTYPADYLGHLLAVERYGQWGNGKYYPTWQPAAHLMAVGIAKTAIVRSGLSLPFHAFEPGLGSGRLALEMSNYCRSLTGWERDHFLIRVSTLNFMLYAPDFALPIPEWGGDLIRGDALTGEGGSIICPARLYTQCPVTLPLERRLEPAQLRPKPALDLGHYKQGALF